MGHTQEAEHWLMFETEADGPALQFESVGMAITEEEAFEELKH